MRIKMWLHYPLLQSLGSYKVHLCFIVLSVTVCTVGYICLFCGDQIFVDFVSFLSMIIYEILYTWCLRYNICSAGFLDIRISTCFNWPWKLVRLLPHLSHLLWHPLPTCIKIYLCIYCSHALCMCVYIYICTSLTTLYELYVFII